MFAPHTSHHWGGGLNSNGRNPNDLALTLRRANDWNRYRQGFRNNFGVDDIGEDSSILGPINGDLDGTIDIPGVGDIEPPWEDEDVFRSEFLDNLKARYAASRQGLFDSCESASGNIGTSDGPWDVPGWDLPQPPRRYTGRCQFNAGNSRCFDNVRNEFSPYCDFHYFTVSGDGIFSATPPPRPRTRFNPRLNTRNYTPSPDFLLWATDRELRSSAYRAAVEDLRNIRQIQNSWESLNGRPSTFNNSSLLPHDTIIGAGPDGPGLTSRQAAEIYIREIDVDNRPFFLKCSVCLQLYNDPVYFWHLETNQLCICCRGCAPSYTPPTYPGSVAPPQWRASLFPRRFPGPRQTASGSPTLYPATKINVLRSLFERHYYAMMTTEAPHQICHFCKNPMVNPVVTCKDVPPMYWILTHGSTPAFPPVKHAFCAGCLDNYRFKGGAHFARCPFTDACWGAAENFPVDEGYIREAQTIAGRAWEKTLQMAS
ncbi:hypothetical protein TWF102_006194 [Orbilia oligospora]|nr:hypothetical protein TWF706_009552 [Orbilia oligospora]KAF3098208.1 hypothetical protein TWF102_006194 [Orbilia oligospora]